MSKDKIILIGEVCKDVFIYGDANRVNPEAPSLILSIDDKKPLVTDGMAGNVHRNIDSLSNNKYNVQHISLGHTLEKTRYVDKTSGQILLRVDKGKIEDKDIFDISTLEKSITRETKAVVVSDYDKGLIRGDSIHKIIKVAEKYGVPTFFDSKKVIDARFDGATFIKINEIEFKRQSSMPYCDNYIYTTGINGCVWFDRLFNETRIPTHKVDVACVSGAGDTVLSALVVKYLECSDVKLSLEYAMKAASIAVTKRNVVAVAQSDIKH